MMGFNAILKTKRVYMLYLLPFILAAIAFLRFTFGPEDFSVCLDLGVISIPDFLLIAEKELVFLPMKYLLSNILITDHAYFSSIYKVKTLQGDRPL